VIAKNGVGTAQGSCPTARPHALSWSATKLVRYSAPLHGSSVAKSGQSATGWRINTVDDTATVTLYIVCGP
jgi:hypothetical protein